MCTLLIVHTSEAQDWATYLKLVLEASHHFQQDSISLFLIDEEHLMQDEDCSAFSSSKCILLLVSVAFLDIQNEPGLRNTFERILYPPSKVIAFLCGVSESDGLTDYFEDWDSWKKLDSGDEPALYVSTVLEVISEENNPHLEHQDTTESKLQVLIQNMDLSVEEPKELPQPEFKSPEEFPDVSTESLPQAVPPTLPEETACLTVQPQRILCGTQVDVYIVMRDKLDTEASMEVKFQCEHSTKCVPGTAVNEYVVRVQSPDMPAGEVSLYLCSEGTIVCCTNVTYYTEMEEISSYFEKVLNPVQFMCQTFNITSNVPEALDDLLTVSLKKQMPSNGLQVFGVYQLETDNTLAKQEQGDMELPTLLHFSAKYGLKKLTSTLLQCPGALQAYSMVNKNGDYPNTLAEKNGFPDLRHFMDDYVETLDLVKTQIEESLPTPGNEDIYEPMANASQNFVAKYSLQEDVYESMMELNPDIDLYDDLSSSFNGTLNPEDAMLRKFFQVKQEKSSDMTEDDLLNDRDFCGPKADDREVDIVDIYGEDDEEEDPYKMCFLDEIYDTIEEEETVTPAVLNRPPAPIPRPSVTSEQEECQTYISTVFSTKNNLYAESSHKGSECSNVPEWTVSSEYDPYAGMKTPGQRQLISLQERVKVGALTVEEAVQEFKAWQFDQEKRVQSVRFQQENLQRLRTSIIRRQKVKGKNKTDLEITAPIKSIPPQCGPSHMNIECSVYEPTPRSMTQQPPANRPLQRGTWHTGSASSTSSSGSNRQSTLSTISFSSGADGEMEELPENPPPPRPPRSAPETRPTLPPPRVPPRIPGRFPESKQNERYVSIPARSHHQTPPNRSIPPPPVARRPR